MKSWLRQHRYAIGVTLRRLTTQPFSSLTNILVMALALALPLLGSAILVSAQPIVSNLSTGPEVTVFLETKAPKEAVHELARKISNDHAGDITHTRVVLREEALAHLRSHPAWADALDVLPGNPLPDAVVITLSGADFAERAAPLASAWRNLPHVDKVQLDSEWVRRLQALLRFGQIGLLLLAAGVAMVVLATVFNTVRMQALAQREEITVARLVGATERFVRRPFLYLGAISSAIAALVAIATSVAGLSLLNNALLDLSRSYDSDFSLHLPEWGWLGVFILLVAILGAFSARVSVSRNTRF